MFQTIIIYTFIPICMGLLGYIAFVRDHNALIRKRQILKFYRIEIILIILLFSCIFGARFNVGEDYENYLDDFKFLSVERYEPIFKCITIFLHENDFHYSVYFFIWALIQIFLLYYTFKDEKYIYPYIAFILFTGQYFLSWMNTIRQDIAGCIFLFSTIFIWKRKCILYLISCFIAMGFHYSSILLFPLYWFLKGNYDYFSKKIFQYCIFLFCSYVALAKIDYAQTILPLFEVLLSSSEQYSSYSVRSIEIFADLTQAGNGITIICQILIDLIIISYSSRLKKEYSQSRFIILYNVYFVGTSMMTLFVNNLIFSRPFRHFRIFKLVITAYLLYYLFKQKTCLNMLCLFVLILLHLIILAATIKYNPFLFYWQ